MVQSRSNFYDGGASPVLYSQVVVFPVTEGNMHLVWESYGKIDIPWLVDQASAIFEVMLPLKTERSHHTCMCMCSPVCVLI